MNGSDKNNSNQNQLSFEGAESNITGEGQIFPLDSITEIAKEAIKQSGIEKPEIPELTLEQRQSEISEWSAKVSTDFIGGCVLTEQQSNDIDRLLQGGQFNRIQAYLNATGKTPDWFDEPKYRIESFDAIKLAEKIRQVGVLKRGRGDKFKVLSISIILAEVGKPGEQPTITGPEALGLLSLVDKVKELKPKYLSKL